MTMTRVGNRAFVFTLAVLALAWFMVGQAQAYDGQTNREASVRVDVQPLALTAGQPAKFKVSMNTHSVELGQDMKAVATLSDDLGNMYQPTEWQGSPPGGHHRSGSLVFPALNAKATTVKLVVRDVSQVPERVFQWKLEK